MGVPVYLNNCFKLRDLPHDLRNNDPFHVPFVRTDFGKRAYSIVGPDLFNMVPEEICEASSIEILLEKLEACFFGQA